VARKLKEESEQKRAAPELKAGSALTAGLGRIPKHPRKEPKAEGPSFGDLLGGLDTSAKPKAIIKNKNKDLLESLLNSSPNKSSSSSGRKEERKKSSSSGKEEARARDKEDRHKANKEERRSSLSGRDGKEKERPDKEKERPDKEKERSDKEKERGSKESKDSAREKNGHNSGSSPPSKPKTSLHIPGKEERRKEGSAPTTPEVKKSPKVIKESNFFGDVLGDIMREQPKKRKRRLSEVKAEREAKEAEKEAKEEAERAKKRKDDEEAKKDSSGSDEEKIDNGEMPFEEPTEELPREVRGILVVARGSRRRGRIQWRPDAELVETHYFEMDDTERANVWKLKSFDECRKAELAREKQAGHAGMGAGAGGEEEEAGGDGNSGADWKITPLVFEDTETRDQVKKIWGCYGRGSLERAAQEEREGRVLK
jgi:hypothetical protein